MTAGRWGRIEEVYHAAMERPPEQRAAFIADACKGDDELRREVEDLMRRERSPAGELLDRSPWQERTLIPGARLGPYEIVALIGAGGMGQVFRARDTRLERSVAIKVSQARFTDRFAREARAIAALNHPNICTIHDVGPDHIVMELIEGPTLGDRMREGALPMDEALAIARQIAAALEAAHEKGIVHRDLKPANIKIRPDGSVKVLDFGLAKSAGAQEAADETVTVTGSGIIVGTPGYMSPEQAKGRPVDKRADIWAFGVVVYEMLAGARLFDGETATEAMAAVLTREPDVARVPASVRKLLRSCLEKDPNRRLRDIGDAWRLLEDAPDAPVPAPVPQPRSRVWIAAAAVAAVLALVTLAGWWRASRPVDHPLMRLALDLGPDAIGGSKANIGLSPDGRRIIFAIRRADGKSQLATRLLDQVQSTVLPGTEGGRQPFFSTDGQWIGYRTGGTISKISVQGGAPVILATASDQDTGGDWDREGNIVAALTHASALSLIPAVGGPARPLTKLSLGEQTHRWPQFLPGGNILFTQSGSGSGMEGANLAIADRKTGAHKIVLRGGFHGRYVGGYLLYMHQGALFAVRFDLAKQEMQGSAVPLAEDVAADSLSGDGHFQFSGPPDGAGTLVYLIGKATSQQYPVTLLDGPDQGRQLIPPGSYFNPAFSPDGRRLALVVGPQNTDIFVYDLARDTMTRLTSDGTSDRPVWTPDGTRIAFTSRRSPPGLYWERSDGGAEPELLLSPGRPIIPWSFSPDGRRLAYMEIAPDTGFDLGILPIDLSDRAHLKPGKPEPFLRTQFGEGNPEFSPDGRWIVYFSNESGTNEVYVRPASGEPGKWQISSGGGMFGAWSPNGRELFYESLDSRLQVVDYTVKGGNFEAGKPRQWSNRQLQNIFKGNFAIAPDGKHIAVFDVPDDSKAPPRVGVLLDFLDELKRRLP